MPSPTPSTARGTKESKVCQDLISLMDDLILSCVFNYGFKIVSEYQKHNIASMSHHLRIIYKEDF